MSAHPYASPETREDEGFEDLPNVTTDAEVLPSNYPPDFSKWPDHWREELVHQLLKTLSSSALKRIYEHLSPRLRIDLFRLLPTEISLHILSFTDGRTVMRLSRVSTYWRRLCTDNRLWHYLFKKEGYGAADHVIRRYMRQHGSLATEMRSLRMTDDDEAAATKDHWSMRIVTQPMETLAFPVVMQSVPQALDEALTRTQYEAEHLALPPIAVDDFSAALKHHRSEDNEPMVNWSFLFRQKSMVEHRWNTTNYTPVLRRLRGHAEGVYCVQSDDNKIVSGSRDDSIRVWNMRSGECMRIYYGHVGSVLCLQYDTDDMTPRPEIVSGGSDSTVVYWDLHTGKVKRRWVAHAESVLNIRYDRHVLLTCSKDRTVRLWRRQTGEFLRTLTGHRVAVNAVQFVDHVAASASGDRTVRLWDLEHGECIRVLEGHQRGIACLEFDGRLVVSGSSDRSIRLWDTRINDGTSRSSEVMVFSGHTDLVRALAWDGTRIVSGSYDATLKLWDVRYTGKMLNDLKHGHSSKVFKVHLDRSRITSCSQDQQIIVWDVAHGLDTAFLA
jgi:WD40 repeat protein